MLTVTGNDIEITSSSEISPTPSIDLDVFDLVAGSTYIATWTSTAGNTTYVKDVAGGGSNVITQVDTNSGTVTFKAESASATIRFFVSSIDVPVSMTGVSILKLHSAE